MYSEEDLLKKINKYISNIQYATSPNELYAPIKYTMDIGGKRIRPILMLLAYNLYKDDIDSILPNAAGLEIYHNFTLLHDDLMDKADMRRGKATVHKKWDANTAILSGDAMLILAYKLMAQNKNEHFSDVLDSFNEATLGVCEGQQYDMDFENRTDVTVEEYMEMIRLKTSLLLAYALKIGAQLAGAPVEDTEHLYKFGEKIGLAFQLQDDLLDVYGDPAIFGKKIGGDIVCNKKTFMLINALNRSTPEQRSTLCSWINQKEFDSRKKITEVTKIYDEINIKDICINKIEELFDEATYHLEQIGVCTTKKDALKNFANKLMRRKY